MTPCCTEMCGTGHEEKMDTYWKQLGAWLFQEQPKTLSKSSFRKLKSSRHQMPPMITPTPAPGLGGARRPPAILGSRQQAGLRRWVDSPAVSMAIKRAGFGSPGCSQLWQILCQLPSSVMRLPKCQESEECWITRQCFREQFRFYW